MTPLRALLERHDGALVMGVLNRTPDSFSDGGRFLDDGAALEQVARMIAGGAAIVDVGAESTRPGAEPISDAEQLARLGGVIGKIAARGVLVSIDTTSAVVAERALGDGASIVNSISLEPARELARVAAKASGSLVLMHCRGAMRDMAGFSVYADDAYGDVVADVAREWAAAAVLALEVLPKADVVLDPGLGFAKNARQSIELCARLDELCALGHPVLVGPSRKSFVARAATGGDAPLPPPAERLGGSIAAALACVARGASIVRAHDVGETRQALAVARAIGLGRSRVTPAREAEARA